jgi:hypothetical protein
MSENYALCFSWLVGEMNSVIYIFGFLLLGFTLYWIFRDKIFASNEGFDRPGRADLEIRKAPVEPPRTITPSGPSPPAQMSPTSETVIYGEPAARDPFDEQYEASDAPEKMRYPENSFRPAPGNDQVQIAQEAGIAGSQMQTSPQAYQKFGTDFVQNSGEFMEGVYANDTMSDTSYSAF